MNNLPSPLAFIALLGSGLAIAGTACTSVIDGGGNGGNGGNGTASGTTSRAAGTSGTGVATSSSGWSTTTSTTASSSSTGWSGTTTTSASSTSGTGSSAEACGPAAPLTGACAPTTACASFASACLAHVSQPGSTTPGFRMAQIVYSKPAALTQGVVASVLQGSTTPNDTPCNLEGSGGISWLLRFDTVAGTLQTGGAKPSSSPAGPYAFDVETVTQGAATFAVQPVTLTAPLGAGCTFDSTEGDVVVPLYENTSGAQPVLLPLRSLRLHAGTLSDDQSCIGRYNAAGLDPSNSCQPDATHQAFTSDAAADAFILLKDADTSSVAVLQESLCVVLSGNAVMYGNPGAGGETVCKRDANGNILFQGDWCSTTNQAATATCADAVQVSATFAAQAVTIE